MKQMMKKIWRWQGRNKNLRALAARQGKRLKKKRKKEEDENEEKRQRWEEVEKRECGKIYVVWGKRVEKEASLQNNIIKIIPIIYFYLKIKKEDEDKEKRQRWEEMEKRECGQIYVVGGLLKSEKEASLQNNIIKIIPIIYFYFYYCY